MTATVPGDVLSDLHRAGKIGDPLYELNFKDKEQQALWMQDWTYTRTFSLLEGSSSTTSAMLVFDSIKMGARVYVDGTLLGTAADQFLRYTFPLQASWVRDRSTTLASSLITRSIRRGASWHARADGTGPRASAVLSCTLWALGSVSLIRFRSV